MTREEAIAYGEDYLKDLISACCHIEEKHKDFVRMAIKALEQEPIDDVLDKVIADIDAKAFHLLRLQNMQRVHGLEDALEVINKYREGDKE